MDCFNGSCSYTAELLNQELDHIIDIGMEDRLQDMVTTALIVDHAVICGEGNIVEDLPNGLL